MFRRLRQGFRPRAFSRARPVPLRQTLGARRTRRSSSVLEILGAWMSGQCSVRTATNKDTSTCNQAKIHWPVICIFAKDFPSSMTSLGSHNAHDISNHLYIMSSISLGEMSFIPTLLDHVSTCPFFISTASFPTAHL